MLLTCLTALSSLAPQEPPARPQTKDPIELFRTLSASKQEALVRGLARRIRVDPHPAIQRIVSMQRSTSRLAVALDQKPFHKAERWAPEAAPERQLVQSSDSRHKRVRQRYPAQTFLNDMHRHVVYDWGRGQMVRTKQALTPLQQLQNLWNGYPQGSDQVVARILAILDGTLPPRGRKKTDKSANPKMRKLAAYFDHLYADLNARAYAGVTLYESWFSGEQQDVPDVDAIPFAVRVLRNRSFRSPIPAGRKRERLYRQIRDHAFRYRIYRTLREATAAAFVSADPAMHTEYKKLVPRFHYLWSKIDDSLPAMYEQIRKVRQRDAFLQKLDREMRTAPDNSGYQRRDGRKKELESMRARLRLYVRTAVQRAAG